jgi:hypothetical protein
MNEQLELTFDIRLPEPSKTRSIGESFEMFHELNPSVYRNLVLLCRQLAGRGRRKIGMKMVFEVLRWNYMLATEDPNSEYRLNNNYTSRYARLIGQQESDLAGLFETRGLKTQ